MAESSTPGTHYAVLLRGINVGGHRRVPMAALRNLLTDLGYRDVRTYLHSGQAVLISEDQAEVVAQQVSSGLQKTFGQRIEVIVRSHHYLAEVVARCPFPAGPDSGRQLHAAFLADAADPSRVEQIEASAFAPEGFELGDRMVYLWLPDGIGRSRLASAVLRPRILGAQAVVTVRNWNTVTTLLELTS